VFLDQQNGIYLAMNFEHAFDNATTLAIDTCNCLISQINLVSVDKQWCRINKVLSVASLDKNTEIHELILNENDFCEVPDTFEDIRFTENKLLVHGKVVRYCAGIPLVMSDGCVIGTLCVMDSKPQKLTAYQISVFRLLASDIASQVELVKKNHELNSEIDEFMHIVSHDLKSPINAIKNVTSWIKEDLAEDVVASNSKYFGMIENSINRMQLLLSGLRHYSQTGRGDSPAEHLNFSSIVKDCCATLDISKEFDVNVNDCEINLPKRPLSIVLSHLISNAIKHHDKTSGLITIHCLANSADYQFSITDDGPGIPLELHEKIFKPFQTLKSKDEIEANGLGLAMVKKILAIYGGTISVTSQVGHGAKFSIVWPN